MIIDADTTDAIVRLPRERHIAVTIAAMRPTRTWLRSNAIADTIAALEAFTTNEKGPASLPALFS